MLFLTAIFRRKYLCCSYLASLTGISLVMCVDYDNGLKQVPRAWYSMLNSFVQSNGFRNSHADASLFVRYLNGHMIYVLIYVDDFIITRSSSSIIHEFICLVCATFHCRDLGSLSFLGLEMHQTSSLTMVSQRKYCIKQIFLVDLAYRTVSRLTLPLLLDRSCPSSLILRLLMLLHIEALSVPCSI